MLQIILIAIYIVGIIICMKIEKKYSPYEEGEYKIDFHGAYKVTPEMHDRDCIYRSILWPLFLAIIIVLLPLKLIDIIYNKL